MTKQVQHPALLTLFCLLLGSCTTFHTPLSRSLFEKDSGRSTASTHSTDEASAPIGIGSGARCDGQVLVFHDMLQYGSSIAPKRFVKTYADIGTQIRSGIARYVEDVKASKFPAEEHAFRSDRPASTTPVYGSSQ